MGLTMNIQKDIWAACTGSDPKEMKIIMNGRNIGKSYMAQMWNTTFAYQEYYSTLTKANVDGDLWLTVRCSQSISTWIKTQSRDMWYEHIDKEWYVHKNVFDMHEKLYTILQLKYSHARI